MRYSPGRPRRHGQDDLGLPPGEGPASLRRPDRLEGNDGTDDEIFTAVAGPIGAFTDVSPDTHYKDAIEDLYARGIVSGYPDGTFRPESPVLPPSSSPR